MTGTQHCLGALRTLGIGGSGQTVTSTEIGYALEALNLMLKSWAAQSLLVLRSVGNGVSLVAGDNLITIGPSGDINTARPSFVERVTLVRNYSTPTAWVTKNLERHSIDDSQEFFDPTGTAPEPTYWYPVETFPLLSVYVRPTPTSSDLGLMIWVPKRVEAFDLSTDVVLPNGYEEAIKYNLAARICDEFARPLTPTVGALAVSTLATVSRLNQGNNIPVLSCDPALVRVRV